MKKLSLNKNQIHITRAFSLIEISIVILIIGILVAGISKGVDLYSDFKLSSARNLTNNSRINRIPDLVFWTETTDDNNLKSSPVADITAIPFGKISNNTKISAWRDRNPQNSNKITQVASTDLKRPTYVTNGINNLPSIKFGGAPNNETLSSLTAPLKAGQKKFTMIAVYQKELQAVGEYVISQATLGSGLGINANIYINGTIQFGCCGTLVSSTPYVAKRNYFTIARLENDLPTNNIYMWVNRATPDVGTLTTLTLANEVFSIGSRSDGVLPFRGLISEVIIFERALLDTEIQEIISYLVKKYNIKLE